MGILPRISVDVSRWLAVGAAALALALSAAAPAAAEESRVSRAWEYYGSYSSNAECEKARQRLQYAPNVWASECRGYDHDPGAALYVQWV